MLKCEKGGNAMTKLEFLDILRQSLYKEVNPDIIEQNIKYYDQYIGNRSQEEEQSVLNELGDPRLIARTIIESEKIAQQKVKHGSNPNYQENYSSQESYNEENENNDQNRFRHRRPFLYTNLKWYHKLIAILVIILILMILFFVGRIIIGFMFTFGLPLLLILFVFYIFRRR